jgi:DNA-binding transcriptional regulator YiaG
MRRVRLPERGPLFERAKVSADALGSLAHHVALLRCAAETLDASRAGSDAGAIEKAAIEYGRQHGLVEKLLTDGPQMSLDSEDFKFMAKAVGYRDQQDRHTKNSAEANARRTKPIDAKRYDELKGDGLSQERIAEQLDVTVPTLRRWRKANGRH